MQIRTHIVPLWGLAAVLALLVSCGGGGGGGEGAPAPTTGTISGYVTVPGTTAADAPAVSSLQATTVPTAEGPIVLKDIPSSVSPKKAPPVVAGLLTEAPAKEDVAQEYHVLFRWQPGTTVERQQAILQAEGLISAGAAFGTLVTYRVQTTEALDQVRARLAGYPELLDLSVVVPMSSSFAPTDNLYPLQWHLTQMGLERAWDVTRGSASIRVAVIDSGIALTHPDFAGRLEDGYDFVSDAAISGDGDGADPDPTDPALGLPGVISHGTHVAGTIGANAGNDGVVGVDHFCTIMPIRALAKGGNEITTAVDLWFSMIYSGDLTNGDLSGYSWFSTLFPTGLPTPRPRPSAPARIINISLGGPMTSGDPITLVFDDILEALTLKGIAVVVAAGNSNQSIISGSTVFMPAASPHVITVAATQGTLERASYSNLGPEVFLAAPGGEELTPWRILSADKTSPYYAYAQGTSMAAPHVSGVCALMLAANPALTPSDLKTLLALACFDLGAPGKDDAFGHGFLMADRAVILAAGTAQPDQLIAYASHLRIETDETSGLFLAGNAGGPFADLGTITYSVVYGGTATDWISGVTAEPSGSDGSVITMFIDRTGLPDGDHVATFTLQSTTGGSVDIPVTLVVRAVTPDPAFTPYHILLVDANTGDTVRQVSTFLPNRSFSFTAVPPGDYLVVAGTDLDSDDYIDDDGEYFGIYQPTPETYLITIVPGTEATQVIIPMTLVDDPTS